MRTATPQLHKEEEGEDKKIIKRRKKFMNTHRQIMEENQKKEPQMAKNLKLNTI